MRNWTISCICLVALVAICCLPLSEARRNKSKGGDMARTRKPDDDEPANKDYDKVQPNDEDYSEDDEDPVTTTKKPSTRRKSKSKSKNRTKHDFRTKPLPNDFHFDLAPDFNPDADDFMNKKRRRQYGAITKDFNRNYKNFGNFIDKGFEKFGESQDSMNKIKKEAGNWFKNVQRTPMFTPEINPNDLD